MKLYGGIDLHSNNSVIALLDEEDRVVYRRRLRNDLELVLAELEPYSDAIEGLVVESTYNWYWLVDGLMEAGYRVHLANMAAIVQYAGLKYADDDSDACWLAKLLRLDLLPEGYIYPKAQPAGATAHQQPAVGPEPHGAQPWALARRQSGQAVVVPRRGSAVAGFRPSAGGEQQSGGDAHAG